MRAFPLRRKRFAVIVLVLALCGMVWWATQEWNSRPSRHPLFGLIYQSEMTEDEEEARTRPEQIGDALRSWLHLAPRPVPTRWLKVGPATLEWSAGNWIYMREMSTNAHAPLWEFALCDRKTLIEITREDLRRDFFRIDDSRGTNVFGT